MRRFLDCVSLLASTSKCVLLLLFFLAPGAAQAHKPSDAYLRLEVGANQIEGRWDIALRDLDAALDLDANNDGKLSWGEVRTRTPQIDAYALSRLAIAAIAPAGDKVAQQGATSKRCALKAQNHALEHHSDGVYLVIEFVGACTVGSGFSIDYHLFDEIDPTHRGVTRVAFSKQAPVALVLDPARGAMVVVPAGATAVVAISTTAPSAAAGTSVTLGAGAGLFNPGGAPSVAEAGFVREGIHHILVGYDHVLFLLCLLLPSVLVRKQRSPDQTPTGGIKVRPSGYWQPAASLGAALWPLAGTVTAFTLAHSITLGLASARVIHLSPRFIEPAIAVTIMLAALNNLQPVITRRIAIITFAFGLVHGFGFAAVLRDLDLSGTDFAWALLQFNLGVEVGQLIVIGIAITPLYLLRGTRWYQNVVLRGGSLFGFVIAAIWFAERVFDFKVLPV